MPSLLSPDRSRLALTGRQHASTGNPDLQDGGGAYVLGRFVAPMTMTCDRALRPSISVSSCDTMRRSTSPCAMQARQRMLCNLRLVCTIAGLNMAKLTLDLICTRIERC